MQFIYVLKLIPKLIKEEAWTKVDHEIVEEHFSYLQVLEKAGKLILAGRTTLESEDNFGLVIIKCTETEATDIMNDDPALKKGIMTATLYPYRVALISEDNV